MASKRQLEANRRNARKSTGPRTTEGKKSSKLKALKHGITAEQVCIPDEDPEVFEDLRQQLVDWHQPEGPEECHLVERIALLQWKLRRIPRAEAGLVSYDYWRDERDEHASVVRDIEYGLDSDDWNEEEASEETQGVSEIQEQYQRAVSSLKAAEARTETVNVKIGLSIYKSIQTLSLLSRYEVNLERSLLRTRAELERLQGRRLRESGKTVEPEEQAPSNRQTTVIDLPAKRVD